MAGAAAAAAAASPVLLLLRGHPQQGQQQQEESSAAKRRLSSSNRFFLYGGFLAQNNVRLFTAVGAADSAVAAAGAAVAAAVAAGVGERLQQLPLCSLLLQKKGKVLLFHLLHKGDTLFFCRKRQLCCCSTSCAYR